jgi:hypothetical protein
MAQTRPHPNAASVKRESSGSLTLVDEPGSSMSISEGIVVYRKEMGQK